MERMKTTHASRGYTSERGSIPMSKWKPPIPRTRVTYEQETSVSLCAHAHQLIETSRPDELRSAWGQHELTAAARWGWGRLPSAPELRVRKHIHVCIPPPRANSCTQTCWLRSIHLFWKNSERARQFISVILASTQVFVLVSAEAKCSAKHSREILQLLDK